MFDISQTNNSINFTFNTALDSKEAIESELNNVQILKSVFTKTKKLYLKNIIFYFNMKIHSYYIKGKK